MSTEMTWQLSTASSAETEALGEQIGKKLKGGEIIELVSDLGGGKTTLVRGIAKGFGSTDKVSSPTFTVNKEYANGAKRIVHYDFYRLHDPGLLQYELTEAINDPDTSTIIEWANIVHDVLPVQRVTIHIKTTGDDTRSFEIHAPQSLAYVIPKDKS